MKISFFRQITGAVVLGIMTLAASSGASNGPERAPGIHETTLSAEETLRRIADRLEANDADGVLKYFDPSDLNKRYFREKLSGSIERTRMVAFFRSATLDKSGWWEENHGNIFDEYRRFRGVLDTPERKITLSVHMVRLNACSMTVIAGIHDPGEWIVFGWMPAGNGIPSTYEEMNFRADKPESDGCDPQGFR